jgi:hypothetical protein
MPATKVDFKREYRDLYKAGRDPALVDVPELAFLMVDGHGDPNTAAEYTQAIEALYTVSYTLKFTIKRAPGGFDYGVMPLEGLWWVKDMSSFTTSEKSDWDWTAMIMQPDEVTQDLFEEALASASAKKSLPAAAKLRLERWREGPAAQVMHVGPYATEGPTIERLHAFIAESGRGLRGKHHEIYLSDPRRTAPEKLKTVIRQPVTDPTGEPDGEL